MKKFIVLLALSLVAAACGGGDEGAFDPEAGFTQGSGGQLRALAYAYQPDTTLGYGYTMGFDMTMSTDFPGADEFGDMEMGMDMAGTMTYDISAGPQEGTVEVVMDMTLADLSFTDLTVGGEAVPQDLMGLGDVSQFEDFIPRTRVVMDAKGDVLEMSIGDVTVPSELLNSGLFGGSGFGDPTGMGLMGSIFGPELPAGEVRTGATWTTTDTQTIPGMGEITVVTSHEIVDETTRNGRNTVVIESVAEMDSITMTMEDLMAAMTDPSLTATLSEEERQAFELEMQMMDAFDFGFEMSVKYDDVTTTTWLDYENGVLVATEGAVKADMTMKIDAGAEGKGSMDMAMDITLNLVLTEDGAGV